MLTTYLKQVGSRPPQKISREEFLNAWPPGSRPPGAFTQYDTSYRVVHSVPELDIDELQSDLRPGESVEYKGVIRNGG